MSKALRRNRRLPLTSRVCGIVGVVHESSHCTQPHCRVSFSDSALLNELPLSVLAANQRESGGMPTARQNLTLGSDFMEAAKSPTHAARARKAIFRG